MYVDPFLEELGLVGRLDGGHRVVQTVCVDLLLEDGGLALDYLDLSEDGVGINIYQSRYAPIVLRVLQSPRDIEEEISRTEYFLPLTLR
jgi:hypothetical protein